MSGTTVLTGPNFTQVPLSSFSTQSVALGLTATGSTRATALQLTATFNQFTTVAASTGTTLQPAASLGTGAPVRIFNAGASVLQVYASGSDTIDGVAGATGVALTNANRCEYFAVTPTSWISAKLGAVST